jgi:hypothetical protein
MASEVALVDVTGRIRRGRKLLSVLEDLEDWNDADTQGSVLAVLQILVDALEKRPARSNVHNPDVLCTCEPKDLARKGICEYRLLADSVGDELNVADAEEAEVSLLITAVEHAKAYIESQPCTCTPEDIADYDPCPRCAAIGRLGDEVQMR